MFTDSHAHLSWVAERLGGDAFGGMLDSYDAAAVEAVSKGLPPSLLVDVGTEPDDLPARIEFLRPHERSSFLRLTAGLWPSAESLAAPERSVAVLEEAITKAAAGGVRVAAIGEGGLDYHHMNASRESQAELFELQLDLALRLGLPMIVHSRDAFKDTLSIVAPWTIRGLPVLIHCFGYGAAEALKFLEAGCYISFAGNLTYKGADALREACTLVSADRLLLETDAPYMNPMPHRGKNSSPLDIERSYAAAAAIRKSSVEDLAELVTRNAHKFFG
jgi:TatD DNase family protein